MLSPKRCSRGKSRGMSQKHTHARTHKHTHPSLGMSTLWMSTLWMSILWRSTLGMSTLGMGTLGMGTLGMSKINLTQDSPQLACLSSHFPTVCNLLLPTAPQSREKFRLRYQGPLQFTLDRAKPSACCSISSLPKYRDQRHSLGRQKYPQVNQDLD